MVHLSHRDTCTIGTPVPLEPPYHWDPCTIGIFLLYFSQILSLYHDLYLESVESPSRVRAFIMIFAKFPSSVSDFL